MERHQEQVFEEVVHDLNKQHATMPAAVGNVNPLERAAVAVHEKFEELKEMVVGDKHHDAANKDNVLLQEYAVAGQNKLSTAVTAQTNSVPLSVAEAHQDLTKQVNSSVATTTNAPIEQRQEHAFEDVVHDLDKQHTVKPAAVGNVNPLEHAAVAVHEKFQEVKEKVAGDKHDHAKQDNPLFKEYAVAGQDKLSSAVAAQVNSVPVSVAEAHEKLTNEVNSSVVSTEDTVSAVHTGIAGNTQVYTADTTAASLNLKSTAPEQVQKITAEHDRPLNAAHDQVASQVKADVTTAPTTVPDQGVAAAREQVAAEVATAVSTVPATVQATGAAPATTTGGTHKHNPFRDFFAKLFAKKPESAKTGLVPAANPTDVHEEHTTVAATTTSTHAGEEHKHNDNKVKEFFHKLKLWFTKPHTPTTDLATSSKTTATTTGGNVTAPVEPVHDKKVEEIKVQVNQEVLEEVRPNNATTTAAAQAIPSTAQTVVTAN